MTHTPPRILIIAGSDSGGGAGIQGDIKTVTRLGGYAATAITALTAQNTLGVHNIHAVPTSFIQQQITVVLEDIGADVIKTGMLHNHATIRAIADILDCARDIPLIVDPVMVAKGGAPLLDTQAIDILVSRLFPLASLITPNIPEATYLTGMAIENVHDMEQAGRALLKLGPKAVLIKGGHLKDSDVLTDILLTDEGDSHFYYSDYIDTPHTHGTGCCLASAIATYIGYGYTLADAITQAHHFVQHAIQCAPKLGHGHGPLGFDRHYLSPPSSMPSNDDSVADN